MQATDVFYFSKLSVLGVEEWLDIPGFEGYYQVSNMGRVASLERIIVRCDGKHRRVQSRILKSPNARGYQKVGLSKENKHFSRDVHVMVALAFLGPRPDGLYVCHNNGNPSDSRLFNLRYDTQKANIQDKEKHGNLLQGETHGRSKLTANDVITIRQLADDGIPHPSIAKLYPVSRPHITEIVNRNAWNHI